MAGFDLTTEELNEEKVFDGLVALAIENGVFDWRDSMMVLVRLHYSAAKIGATPLTLFQRAATISSAETKERLLQFATRRAEDLDLAKFGFKEGLDSSGNFAYLEK